MNPTDTADTTMDESIYHNYYLYENIPKPCTKEGVKAFGGLFLPPLYSLVFLFGLLGNSVVVLVLFKYKRLKSMTDVYLLNLAISDLLFVFSLPFWGYYAADQWVFGLGLCKIISWMYLVGFYSGIFFVMLMSIDRYLAIVHAVFSLRARTLTYGVITSLATWSVAVLASLPGFLFSTCYTERNHTYCKTKHSLNSTRWKVLSSLEINILGLVIPLGTMLFCYSMIIRTLQHRYATMSHVSEFNLVCTVSAATGKLPHDNLKVYGPFRTSSLSLSLFQSHFHDRGDNVFRFLSLQSGNIFYRKLADRPDPCGCFVHLLTNRAVEIILSVGRGRRELLSHGGGWRAKAMAVPDSRDDR